MVIIISSLRDMSLDHVFKKLPPSVFSRNPHDWRHDLRSCKASWKPTCFTVTHSVSLEPVTSSQDSWSKEEGLARALKTPRTRLRCQQVPKRQGNQDMNKQGKLWASLPQRCFILTFMLGSHKTFDFKREYQQHLWAFMSLDILGFFIPLLKCHSISQNLICEPDNHHVFFMTYTCPMASSLIPSSHLLKIICFIASFICELHH